MYVLDVQILRTEVRALSPVTIRRIQTEQPEEALEVTVAPELPSARMTLRSPPPPIQVSRVKRKDWSRLELCCLTFAYHEYFHFNVEVFYLH